MNEIEREDTGGREPRHPIRVVANRTGLTPSVLRAWERRYSTVEPARSDGGQRLYTDRDVEKLRLLKRITDAGRAIGTVADLSLEEVRELAAEDAAARRAAPTTVAIPATDAPPAPDTFRAPALQAVTRMDADALEAVLRRAVVVLGAEPFLDGLLAPLLVEVGQRWEAGRLRPAQEHVATAVARRVLSWMAAPAGEPSGPPLVLGTLPGEVHELGALLAATSAALEGWAVTYLGGGLPIEDIVAAAETVGARVVGVSVVHAADGSAAAAEALDALRRGLAPGVALLVGGRLASEVVGRTEVSGVTTVHDLAGFREALRVAGGDVRRGASSRAATFPPRSV